MEDRILRLVRAIRRQRDDAWDEVANVTADLEEARARIEVLEQRVKTLEADAIDL
jgi:hypothetical protein